MALIDTWYDAYAHKQIGRGIRQAMAYDLVYKALGAIVLGPVLAWMLERIVALSGSITITNEAIAGFLLSPVGVPFVLFAVAFTLLAFYAEQAGLMHVAAGASRGAAASWSDALATAVAALPRLLTLALWQAGILLLWLLPLAAAAGLTYKALLGAHDINWYLAERPPEFLAALAIGGVLALAGLVIVLRLLVNWALSIPICLYERRCGRAALAESRERIEGHRLRALRLLAGNLLLVLAAGAGIGWMLDAVLGGLLGLIDGLRPLVITTALAVMALAAFGVLLSFVLMAVYALMVMHLYFEQLGIDGLRKEGWESTTRTARLSRGIIVLALLALLAGAGALIHAQLDDLRIGRDVKITAHRGGAAHAPENTLSAIYQAASDGADMVEIDVQETADGVIVLLHDSDLMRVAGLPRAIWDVEYDELRAVDVGRWFSPEFANEPVPTLKEALMAAESGLGLNIELKYNGHDQRLAERVVELVREAGCGNCILTSLNQQALARVRELAPEIPIGQIVTAAVGDPKRLDVDLLSMNQAQVTPQVVRANRAAGLETHVWTVDDLATMEKMVDMGVDNIITDQPGRLHALLQERAPLSDGDLLLLALGRQMRD